MYLLAICTSSFENSMFKSCIHFFIGLLILWGWVFWILYRFWILVSYQMNSWHRFSSILWESLKFSDCFFCCAEPF
jgi:hypothetical protein